MRTPKALAAASRGRVGDTLAGAFIVAMIVIVSGCGAIVGADIPAYTCTGSDLRSCPGGQYCRGSGCVACEERDVCDGYDNDCNGKVDDGPSSDKDADGFTFCGQGGTGVADCDDGDANVNGNAREECNGKDDDCDGIVDNPDKVCPSGQTCIPKASRCAVSDTLCTPENCPKPKQCDETTQECVTPGVIQPGTLCTSNRSCATGICGDASILTRAVTNALGGNVCTQTCCSSGDCPAEQVCYTTGLGGSFCIDKKGLALPKLGAKVAGEACADGGDCRSGACEGSPKRCVDSCCSDAGCPGGTLCQLGTLRGVRGFACQTSNASREQNATCNNSTECRSNVCTDLFGGGWAYRCAAPCCGSTKCGSFNFGGPVPLRCEYFKVASGDTGEVASLCAEQKQGNGSAPLGTVCRGNADCLSERCVDDGTGTKKCTDVCCTDADCSAVPNWVCRPSNATSHVLLSCGPK